MSAKRVETMKCCARKSTIEKGMKYFKKFKNGDIILCLNS